MIPEEFLATAPSSAPAFEPSPTAERFMAAVANGPPTEMRLLVLESSRGEGKTTSTIYAVLELAERLRREGREAFLPVRVAVVRDTWVSLERTTLRSFEEQRMRGLPVIFTHGRREARIEFDVLLAEFFFFGLDRPEDADKFQGFSCGVLWIEEPAPAAGLTAGVPIESLAIGATSVRQPGVPPRILLTMNPPDSDSWVLKVEERLREVGLPELKVAVFRIPPGEKSEHFRVLAQEAQTAAEARAWDTAAKEFDNYRTRNRALLEAAGRLDLVARLVEGQVGDVQVGEAVVPPFSRELHVAKEPLTVYRSLPILRFWDGGGTPSCVFAQDLPNGGGLNVLASRTGQNISMEEFIRDYVKPLQATYGWLPGVPTRGEGFGRGASSGFRFRDIGDPSMLHEGKTVSADLTSALVIQQMLTTGFEPGPVSWSARREALLSAFSRAGKGHRPRFIQLDPEENDMLVKSLGRLHYPTELATGRVVMTIEAAKRASGIYAQSPDALGYGLAVLHPAEQWIREAQRQPAPRPPPPPPSWLSA